MRARLAVEASVAQGCGDAGDVFSAERFGSSAPANVLLREYAFSVEKVHRRALALTLMASSGRAETGVRK